MPYRAFHMGLLLAASVAIIGCSEPTGVSLHEPGVYKGRIDDLLEKQSAPAHQAELRARLTLVQTDR